MTTDNEGKEGKGGENSQQVVQVGQIVSSITVFEVTVKFNFGRFLFYFLKPDAAAVFLSLIGEKGLINEFSAKKKGKKYYLDVKGNKLGEEIEVIEMDRGGVEKTAEEIDEKLRNVISGFNPLEFGLTQRAVNQILEG